jgi:putative ABC transport system permease protein
LENIRRTPGFASAAESDVVPLSGNGADSRVWLESSRHNQAIDAKTHFIGDGYMATMGIRLLAGREFDGRDTVASPRAAIINQALARQLKISGNPIGQHFRKEATPWKPETTFEVVGLVSDTKYFSLKKRSVRSRIIPSARTRIEAQTCKS